MKLQEENPSALYRTRPQPGQGLAQRPFSYQLLQGSKSGCSLNAAQENKAQENKNTHGRNEVLTQAMTQMSLETRCSLRSYRKDPRTVPLM